MKVLITGASGLLGKYLFENVPANIEVEGTWYATQQLWTAHRLDVCDVDLVKYVVSKVRPDAIVHMAAVGNVDWCQLNYREAWRINVEGTRNVASVAEDIGARFMLTSSNAVFAGDDPPYHEEQDRKPVNAYGKMRRAAEDAVVYICQNWQITRLFLLYGWEPEGARGNWASKAARRLAQGKRMRVVGDVMYQPTFAGDAARAVWKILTEGNKGTWNVSPGQTVSLFEFVCQVARTYDLDLDLVERIEFADLADLDLAPRPIDSSYDVSKVRSLGIECSGPAGGLEKMYRGEC